MDPHREFVRGLPPEEFQLLVIRKILYEGLWEEMEADLTARRDGKPFIFKLQSRIDEDLDRIRKLKAYETEHGVDLSEFVPADQPAQESRAERQESETS